MAEVFDGRDSVLPSTLVFGAAEEAVRTVEKIEKYKRKEWVKNVNFFHCEKQCRCAGLPDGVKCRA